MRAKFCAPLQRVLIQRDKDLPPGGQDLLEGGKDGFESDYTGLLQVCSEHDHIRYTDVAELFRNIVCPDLEPVDVRSYGRLMNQRGIQKESPQS